MINHRPVLSTVGRYAFTLVILIIMNGRSRGRHGQSLKIKYRHTIDVKTVNGTPTVDYNIYFTWNTTQDSILGFMLKFEDVEHISNLHYRGNLNAYKQSNCSDGNAKLFYTKDGNDGICEFPCANVIRNETAKYLCDKWTENYRPAYATTTSVKEKAIFGRVYKFYLIRFTANKTFAAVERDILTPRFCREELISRHNYTPGIAETICEQEGVQDISATLWASGPPAAVEKYHVTIDLENNRGNITFRCKKPYDISKTVDWSKFTVQYQYKAYSDAKKVIPYSKSTDEMFYYFIAYNVILGNVVEYNITPTFSQSKNQKLLHSTTHGVAFSDTFVIPDIDACNKTELVGTYCDSLAICEDLLPTNRTPATCQCMDGYVGNGISKNITSGTGCREKTYCPSILCHHYAICVDGKNIANSSRCRCPNFYYGNGFQSGSGCTHISLPLGIASGILVCIICTSLVTIRIYQARSKAAREMELAWTKYVDDCENGELALQSFVPNLLGNIWEISPDHLEFEEVIGRGSFGVVRKAKWKTDSDTKVVAVKCTPDALDSVGKESFVMEIVRMSTVGNHPNIITMIGFCCKSVECPLGMVVEYMKYGDLLGFLWDARKEEVREIDPIYNLTEPDVCKIAQQCIKGLKYLKKIKIIHGDVAARNVLVAEDLRCKLSDFGLSTDVYCTGRITDAKERKLPLKWVSPERMNEGSSPITWRSDIWSFGILLYEIVTFGASPYPGVPNNQLFNVLQQGGRMTRPRSCSTEFYDLMLKCWQWKPMRRPSFDFLESQINKIHSQGGVRHLTYAEKRDGSSSSWSDEIVYELNMPNPIDQYQLRVITR